MYLYLKVYKVIQYIIVGNKIKKNSDFLSFSLARFFWDTIIIMFSYCNKYMKYIITKTLQLVSCVSDINLMILWSRWIPSTPFWIHTSIVIINPLPHGIEIIHILYVINGFIYQSLEWMCRCLYGFEFCMFLMLTLVCRVGTFALVT